MSQTLKLPQEKATLSEIVENGFVSQIVVSPAEDPYNHQITLTDQSGNKVGDYAIDNSFGSVDNLLHALLVACANGLAVSAWKNNDNGQITTVSVQGIKG